MRYANNWQGNCVSELKKCQSDRNCGKIMLKRYKYCLNDTVKLSERYKQEYWNSLYMDTIFCKNSISCLFSIFYNIKSMR